MKAINHEYYVSLEVAKLLKEAGFDWECCYCYDAETKDFLDDNEGEFNFNEGDDNDFYSAPTLDVAQRWLREVKGLLLGMRVHDNSVHYAWEYTISSIDHVNLDDHDFPIIHWLCDNYEDTEMIIHHGERFIPYEEAQEAGIKKALELILEKGK